MKKHKNIGSFVFVLASFFISSVLHAQNLDKAVVQDFINSKNFVFKAQTALPLSGSSKMLTSDYDVRFLGDSIVAYLPYYGRAYTAVYGTEGGGIHFTSTKFEYKAKPRKKGGWEVSIRPSDTRDVRELNFTISENGNASLQVTSNNRQPISFQGYVMERK